jgi:hypothetical protein
MGYTVARLRGWVSGLVLLALAGLSAQPAQAQQMTNPQCQQYITQNVVPLLQNANRYNPNGVSPGGWAPVVQPFATNPAEYGLYPVTAPWVAGYAATPFNPQVSGDNTAATSVMPGAPVPPDLGAYAPTDAGLSPELSATAILETLRSSGALDRMSDTDRADWLMRLANLQRDQANYRRDVSNSQRDTVLAQFAIQRDAYNAAIAARRAAYDLSNNVQNLARGWRDTYTSYASVALNLLSTTCNPNAVTGAGAAGAAPTNMAQLALNWRTTTPFDPNCVLVR